MYISFSMLNDYMFQVPFLYPHAGLVVFDDKLQMHFQGTVAKGDCFFLAVQHRTGHTPARCRNRIFQYVKQLAQKGDTEMVPLIYVASGNAYWSAEVRPKDSQKRYESDIVTTRGYATQAEILIISILYKLNIKIFRDGV